MGRVKSWTAQFVRSIPMALILGRVLSRIAISILVVVKLSVNLRMDPTNLVQ